MIVFLRSWFSAYIWVEPAAFRCAEQFGLDEAPCTAPISREPAFARV